MVRPRSRLRLDKKGDQRVTPSRECEQVRRLTEQQVANRLVADEFNDKDGDGTDENNLGVVRGAEKTLSELWRAFSYAKASCDMDMATKAD